jgi:predicted nuclease of predicted toxin-antitoxin system
VRVLLDESVPKRLGNLLKPNDVAAVAQRGWRGLSNGDLLSRAAADFEVLVTADRRMQHQQNLSRYRIAVVVLVARKNRLKDYEPLVPALLQAIAAAEPGKIAHVAA